MANRQRPRPITKHPLAIAWDEWIASDEGISCIDTLPTARTYLENRLSRAFDAGVKAQEKLMAAGHGPRREG